MKFTLKPKPESIIFWFNLNVKWVARPELGSAGFKMS